MRKTVFEKGIEVEDSNIKHYAEKVAYYSDIKETGERLEEVSFEKIKHEKIRTYLKFLKNLPSVHAIRYASEAKLNQLRNEELDKLDTQEKLANEEIEIIKSALRGLERDENDNLSEEDDTERIMCGRNINDSIYDEKRQLEIANNKIDKIEKKREYLRSLKVEELREYFINVISNSENLIKQEDFIEEKWRDFSFFEIMSRSPRKVKVLAKKIEELDEYRKEISPKPYDYPRTKWQKKALPNAMVEDIFLNDNVYSSEDEAIVDPGLAHQIACEYARDCYWEKEHFNEKLFKFLRNYGPAYKDLFKYLIIQDRKKIVNLLPSQEDLDKEAEVIDYFSKDHYDDIKSMLYYLDSDGSFETDNYRLIDTVRQISKALKDIPTISIFKRKKINELRSKLIEPQIKLYRNIWRLAGKMHVSLFKYTRNPAWILEDYVNDPDFPLRLVDQQEKVKDIYEDTCDLRDTMRELSEQRNREDAEYNDNIAKKVQEIVDMAGGIKCDSIYLLSTLKGDKLIRYIYDRAAIATVRETIVDSQNEAYNQAFEEEARIRKLSLPDLHRILMKDQEEKLTEAHIQALKDVVRELQPKTMTLKNSSENEYI